MIKIFSDEYKTKAQVTKAIKAAKAEILAWQTGEGIPKPQFSPSLQGILEGKAYQLIKSTREEWIASEAIKAQEEMEKAAQKKLEKNPQAFNQKLDEESNLQIKAWCQSQGKNEEYYLWRALEKGLSDKEVKNYLKQKQSILTAQKAKKK